MQGASSGVVSFEIGSVNFDLLDDARNRARNKLVVVGVGMGLAAVFLLVVFGGALLMAMRSIG